MFLSCTLLEDHEVKSIQKLIKRVTYHHCPLYNCKLGRKEIAGLCRSHLGSFTAGSTMRGIRERNAKDMEREIHTEPIKPRGTMTLFGLQIEHLVYEVRGR